MPSATSLPTIRTRRWTSISSEMDVYLLCLPASYLNAGTKWGLGFGISCRPIMPTSTKVFLSKSIQPETPEFLQDLRISREDVQLLKRYNMLSVM